MAAVMYSASDQLLTGTGFPEQYGGICISNCFNQLEHSSQGLTLTYNSCERSLGAIMLVQKA
jgi:hypothetical protein